MAGQCHHGHENNEKCSFNYKKTGAFIVAHINKFIIYYYPILECSDHGVVCRTYFQDKFVKNKLYLNTKMGDELINNPSFWTLSQWNQKKWDEGLGRRFHIDDELLLALHRAVLVESMFKFNITVILL